ncbi:hypothetical protein HOD20_02905 [archaeon]|jgi:hypothetical protein|nr:hypothetical protein [archaeon]MBT4647744.1 hypothetical protein [archaeon]MBT6821272.1 hypothetical protein [archaeon]MBT7392051.1 hypothetical protein [archaeon]
MTNLVNRILTKKILENYKLAIEEDRILYAGERTVSLLEKYISGEKNLDELPNIVSIPTIDTGLGNLKSAYSLADGLEAVLEENGDENTLVFAEFSDRQNPITDAISEKMIRGPHKKSKDSKVKSINDVLKFLSGRAEDGKLWSEIQNMGEQILIEGSYAAKIAYMSAIGLPVTVLGAHERPMIALKNMLISTGQNKKVKKGLYVPDTIPKPGLIRLKNNFDFVIFSSTFEGNHDYGKNERFKKFPVNKEELFTYLSKEGGVRYDGTPLPNKTLLADAFDIQESRQRRKKEIEKIIQNYSNETGTFKGTPIKVTFMPSGSGMNPEAMKEYIGQMQPYVDDGRINLSIFATQSYMLDLVSGNSVSEEYDLNMDGIQIVHIPEGKGNRQKKIMQSYRMMDDAHVMICMPGEQPDVGAVFGLPSIVVEPGGYNEVKNMDNAIASGYAVKLEEGENISDKIIRLLPNTSKRIFNGVSNLQKYSFEQIYQDFIKR